MGRSLQFPTGVAAAGDTLPWRPRMWSGGILSGGSVNFVQPPAEMEIDEALVQELLAEQHPDLASLPLRRIDAGWDNDLWRLGEAFIVRLPRRLAAVALTLNEQQWLPGIAAALPLPVPTLVRVGRPGARFPWPWSVVPYLRGKPGDRSPLWVHR
jgi:aminoglycoside phosphotransferase (APT) family kinase protein